MNASNLEHYRFRVLSDTRHNLVMAETNYTIRLWPQMQHIEEGNQDIQNILGRYNLENQTLLLPHYFYTRPGIVLITAEYPKVSQWIKDIRTREW